MAAEELALGLTALIDGMQFFYTSDPQACGAQMSEAVLAKFFSRVVFGAEKVGSA
jgi:hypothetical protein